MSSSMRRLFVAIPLPDDVREALHAAAAPLRNAAEAAVTWTPAERLHLTVKFLGDTEESLVAPLQDELQSAAAGHVDVPLVLRGAGAFPTLRRPRVVWVGVEPSPRLELLYHDIEESCVRLGIPSEGRPFRPHVTLGRVKARLEPGVVRALGRAAAILDFESEGTASSLDLMQSTLTRQGPTYRRLFSVPLRAS